MLKKTLIACIVLVVAFVSYLYVHDKNSNGNGGYGKDSIVKGRIIVDLIYFSNLMKIKDLLKLDSTVDYRDYEAIALKKGNEEAITLAKENFSWKVQFYSVFQMRGCDTIKDPGCVDKSCDCAIHAGCCCPVTLTSTPSLDFEKNNLLLVWNAGDISYLDEKGDKVASKKYIAGTLRIFNPDNPEQVAFVQFSPDWRLPWKKYLVNIKDIKYKLKDELKTRHSDTIDIMRSYRLCQ